METIKKYVESHKDRFLDELFELIRIPSVSSKKEAKEDMIRAADHIKQSVAYSGR
jgi:acetylornithine deacetylase/succinyl-diaminopimelate desuccinylase-like protein